MTGTSPAHDTRWSSSKTAADTAKLWDTLHVATPDDQPIHRWIEAKGRRR
jgi:hypothetical protein